jgi:integrase/recombinase XerC
MAATVHRIRTAAPRILRASAEEFLDTIRSSNTRRAYSIAIVKAVDRLDGRAAVGKWLTWCREQGWDAPIVPASAARSTPPDSMTPVRTRAAIDRFTARRDIHIREKTLWRMLYETCARAEELLPDQHRRPRPARTRAPVKSKGAKPRTRRHPPRTRPRNRLLGRRHRPPTT